MPEMECYASKWNAFHLLENKDAQEPLFFYFFFHTHALHMSYSGKVRIQIEGNALPGYNYPAK